MSNATPLDVEIERVTAAVQRTEVRLRELRVSAQGACCPSCYHGDRYTRLAESQGRRVGWLMVLLSKRSGSVDPDLLVSLLSGAWP